jgi:hypothetical protein
MRSMSGLSSVYAASHIEVGRGLQDGVTAAAAEQHALVLKITAIGVCLCVLQYFSCFQHITSEYERRQVVQKFEKLNSKLAQVGSSARPSWHGVCDVS